MTARPRRLTQTALLLVLAAATACGPPPEADFPPSAPPDALGRPELAPTARFDSLREGSGPDRERLQDETDTLNARAAALRARAATLDTPVLDEETRTRLEDGLAQGTE